MSSRLPINEIFETVQGEASFTGTPSVFVRLQGCDVGCPWCDTKHTWEVDKDSEVDQETMLAKTGDSNLYCWMEPYQILARIRSNRATHIVITGGEPCMYDLSELTSLMIASGFSVQIETSGTRDVFCHTKTFVTLSPKINMPGGYAVRDTAIALANELKMPVGKPSDVESAAIILNRAMALGKSPIMWLQPLSASAKATQLCIEEATARGWRISIQTHKMIGVR